MFGFLNSPSLCERSEREISKLSKENFEHNTLYMLAALPNLQFGTVQVQTSNSKKPDKSAGKLGTERLGSRTENDDLPM